MGRAREAGGSALMRGLSPAVAGSMAFFLRLSWGLRPGFYAAARYRGLAWIPIRTRCVSGSVDFAAGIGREAVAEDAGDAGMRQIHAVPALLTDPIAIIDRVGYGRIH